MSDIVERLRATLVPELYVEAADEIERLRAVLAFVRERCPQLVADAERTVVEYPAAVPPYGGSRRVRDSDCQ